MPWKRLTTTLIKAEILKTPHIIHAFNKIDRTSFMPENIKKMAYTDSALPIGFGQTISQPTTVAIMLELLQPEEGDRILDIGFGSGFSTALLAEITGETGQVFAIELIEKLYEFGKKNVKKLNYKNAHFFLGNGSQGLAKFAPYDRILVSAATNKIPLNLKKQLNSGGRLVIPIGGDNQSLVLVEKIKENQFSEEYFPGFMFVKLKE